MPDSPDLSPKDGEEAARRAMARLRDAVLFRRNNPHVREWEKIDDRNNFAGGIAATMRYGRTA